MIGLDTNVLVRYLLQDDQAQACIANRVIDGLTEQNPGFVTIPALCELNRVLKSVYKFPKTDRIRALNAILSTAVFEIENHDACTSALGHFAKGKADFSDYLIREIAWQAGCDKVVTFDKIALKEEGFAAS